MTAIYLIRHGQANFGGDNYDQLSDKGIEQATLLGQYLQKKMSSPTTVTSGNMFRHKQTAKNSLNAFSAITGKGAITGEEDIIPNEDVRWNEYDHRNILGVYNAELATPSSTRQYLAKQSNSLEHFKTLFINAINQWTLADNNQDYTESFETFSQRVIAALKDVTEQNQAGNIIIYTSGGPISIIICYLLGIPLSRFIDVNLSLVNGGVTKVVTRGKERKLVLSTLNEHDIFEQHADKKLITYT
ncbi:hypothetical protein A9Q74_06785 [Colwellia sp. 39_35_sub15_T18]|nr:hypothetical protein A9Q74_06785 [Colwellia sp. 39_35_sub15_T18]